MRVTYSGGFHLRQLGLRPGHFTLTQGFTVKWDSPRGRISFYVADGFETDLASIPVAFRGAIPQMGRWNQAAICHDWIYRGKAGPLTKAEADLLFLHGMAASGVAWWRRHVIYLAVRLGGRGHWG